MEKSRCLRKPCCVSGRCEAAAKGTDARIKDDVGAEQAATEPGHERVEEAVVRQEDAEQAREEEDEQEGVEVSPHRSKVVFALQVGEFLSPC